VLGKQIIIFPDMLEFSGKDFLRFFVPVSSKITALFITSLFITFFN
jgi:hypothetical protein